MKNKLLWLIIGSLVALAMVLASCAPTTTTTTTTTQQPTTTTQQPTTTTTTQQPTTTTTTTTTTTKTKTTGPATLAPETPKYGGVFTLGHSADPARFDEYWTVDYVTNYYRDTLITGDWAKGPAGTNEFDWMEPGVTMPYLMTGGLAESWEFPDPKTIILRLRPGVRWGLNPDSEASRLVNGREFVAEDVIKDWERKWTNPASKQSLTVPRPGISEVYAPDKYTVVVRWKSDPAPGHEFEARLGWGVQLNVWHHRIGPWEVPKKYGDERDWRNAVGTGPYFLVDYIPGSMVTFKRNPNYYMFDLINPENRLPYVETQRVAIIPDLSARMAAMRTGKIDHLRDIKWDDAASLIRTNPDLKYASYLSGASTGLAFRTDKLDQPWYKQEVRQALFMAIDFQSIVRDYYGGNAAFPAFPISPRQVFIDAGAYMTMDELPADIQELFSYNPTKAKQMLADAGYPNGFKASIITRDIHVDLLQMVKAWWAAVGVDLELQVKETAVYNSIYTTRTHSELISGAYTGTYPLNLMQYLPGEYHNSAMYTGPEMSALALKLDEVYFDVPEVGRIYREILPNLYRLALYINLSQPYDYTFWQPWVQNYHGEYSVGNAVSPNFVKYLWVDMDLKKAAGK